MVKRPWAIPAACLLIGAILRLARFPHGDSPSQLDEISYLSNGLLMLEGETSINKYAPSGPLTWFSAAYAGIRAIATLIADHADISGFPALLRPAAALESTLFGLYADMTGLRLAVVTLTVLLSLAGIWAACRLGQTLGGTTGQILSGTLAATLPIFVELSTETRPYASAWAFALMALAAAATGRRPWATGILLGLAVGSHIDMLRVVPLVLFLQWRRPDAARLQEFSRISAIALVTFLIVAPWYLPHVIDNIRQIMTVRVLDVATAGYSSLSSQWFQAGIALPLLVALAGLLFGGLRRNRPALACGIWLALNAALAARPSGHGLQHDGALLVMIVALVPLGTSLLPAFTRKPIPAALLAIVILAPALWQGTARAFVNGRSLMPDQSIAWVEANVPAGTHLYLDSGQFRALLPTPAAATRLWADVAAPDAWIAKYEHDTARLGVAGPRPLRVMSSDHLDSDRGNRRRFYLLGVPLAPERPRYDIWSVSEGSFFDLTPPAVLTRLCKDGGVYLHAGIPFAGWPAPAISWIRGDGNSTTIYRVAPGECAG